MSGAWKPSASTAVILVSALFGNAVVVLAAALISSVIVIYTAVCLPIMYPRHAYPIHHDVTLGCMAWISFNVVFQYVAALSISPNAVPLEQWPLARPSARTTSQQRICTCPTCHVVRPMRARHCYMCGCCVMKLDHHCPWINNCVGHQNHRYFLLFLIYLGIGTAWCGLGITNLKGHMGLPLGVVLWEIPSSQVRLPNLPHWSSMTAISAMDHVVVLFVQVLCAAIFAAMVGFVGWCGYMAITNQTAYEYATNQSERERWNRMWSADRRRSQTYRATNFYRQARCGAIGTYFARCVMSLQECVSQLLGASWFRTMICCCGYGATSGRLSAAVSQPPYRSPFDVGWRLNLVQLLATQGDDVTTCALRGENRNSTPSEMRTCPSWFANRIWLVLLWGAMPTLEPLAMEGYSWPRWDAVREERDWEFPSSSGWFPSITGSSDAV